MRLHVLLDGVFSCRPLCTFAIGTLVHHCVLKYMTHCGTFKILLPAAFPVAVEKNLEANVPSRKPIGDSSVSVLGVEVEREPREAVTWLFLLLREVVSGRVVDLERVLWKVLTSGTYVASLPCSEGEDALELLSHGLLSGKDDDLMKGGELRLVLPFSVGITGVGVASSLKETISCEGGNDSCANPEGSGFVDYIVPNKEGKEEDHPYPACFWQRS
ncbi:hypothetical protein CPC08DRAFT_722253 [Agrocybe pediades]|nr:hypothetical protein CPC08DRAFT_722253 [Agrocybe pediades]